jgi:soluble lytic murein transglycosylase-like protein
MQLMPGTAARFGVRNAFDPAQNISGGTQYLKELLKMFGGRIDLALASYNAGEGAVLKYGRTIPPYRETREYVRRITRRYGTETKDSQERRSQSPQ